MLLLHFFLDLRGKFKVHRPVFGDQIWTGSSLHSSLAESLAASVWVHTNFKFCGLVKILYVFRCLFHLEELVRKGAVVCAIICSIAPLLNFFVVWTSDSWHVLIQRKVRFSRLFVTAMKLGCLGEFGRNGLLTEVCLVLRNNFTRIVSHFSNRISGRLHQLEVLLQIFGVLFNIWLRI